MPGFRVHLNGRKLSTSGVGELGVLTAMVTWVRRTDSRKPATVEEELSVSVGGLITPTEEHVKWLDRELKIGDEIRIQVVENAPIDRPRRRVRRDSNKERRATSAKWLKHSDGKYSALDGNFDSEQPDLCHLA